MYLDIISFSLFYNILDYVMCHVIIITYLFIIPRNNRKKEILNKRK